MQESNETLRFICQSRATSRRFKLWDTWRLGLVMPPQVERY